MGVSLDYTTAKAATDDVRKAVEEKARAVNSSFEWWCEGINILPPGDPGGPIAGSTKLFLPGYSTNDGGYVEVDALDDMFMACFDADVLLRTLTKLAEVHDLAWEIEMEGPIGVVDADGPDEGIREVLGMLSMEAGYDPEDPEGNEARAHEIRQRYASRND